MAEVKPNLAKLALFMSSSTKSGSVGKDMNDFGEALAKEASSLSPVDSGRLQAGWRVKKQRSASGSSIRYRVTVYNIEKYSAAIERGSGPAAGNAPYWPPTRGRRGNIFVGWAQRKGFVVAVLKDIVHDRGTKPYGMLKKGVEKVKPRFRRLFGR